MAVASSAAARFPRPGSTPCPTRIAASTASAKTSGPGQSRALEPDSKRWAKVYEKSEEGESDSKINLSDFEMDFSETGR